jgi:hypothetical protein
MENIMVFKKGDKVTLKPNVTFKDLNKISSPLKHGEIATVKAHYFDEEHVIIRIKNKGTSTIFIKMLINLSQQPQW